MAAQAHGLDPTVEAVKACATARSLRNSVDNINMPAHYRMLPVECIDVTEHFNFTLGNAIKYIWRADFKGKPIEDLKKAVWYLQREIARREHEE